MSTQVVICGLPRSGTTLLYAMWMHSRGHTPPPHRESALEVVDTPRQVITAAPRDIFEIEKIFTRNEPRKSRRLVLTVRDPRSVIVSEIHSLLGLDATLEDVDINPFALTLRLEKFSLTDAKQAPLVAFDELDVNAQLSSIVNRAFTLSEFRVVKPFVRVERDAQSRLNLKALIPPEEPNAEPEPESPPPRLIIASAVVDGGRIAVIDRSGRQPYETELGPLDMQVSDLNTLPNQEGDQQLVVQTRFGGRLEWTGKMTVRPFTASGHISLAGEKLTRISAYLPAELLASIDDGALDAEFDYYLWTRDDRIAAEIANVSVAVRALGIVQRPDAGTGPDLLRLGEIVVEGGPLTLQISGANSPAILVAMNRIRN